MCLGFEDGINNSDEYFEKTLDDLMTLIKAVKGASIFSENETFNEIDPQNLCFLLVPYYMAETSFRVMDN
jgi:hypothetical protein